MQWVSKVLKATVGAAERRADIQQELHMSRKTNYMYDVTFSTVFADDFIKNAAVMIGKGDISS